MSDDQLPNLEIDFSGQDAEGDGELLEVAHDVSPDERVVRVFFPNAGGGGEPADKSQEEASETPPYGLVRPELPEEPVEIEADEAVPDESSTDEPEELAPELSPIKLPTAPRDRPPTDEFLPHFVDTDEFDPVPEEDVNTEELAGEPTPIPRSLSEVVSDLAADSVEAELTEEPVLEKESGVEHKSLRPIDDILFMLEEDAETDSAITAETRPAMRTPQKEDAPEPDEVAGEEAEIELAVADLSPQVEQDHVFELPAFEPVAELQYSAEVQHSEEVELEPESHRRRRKKRKDRRIKAGVLAVLIIGVILLVAGGALLWTIFQNQADTFVAGLLQGEETALPTQTLEGSLLEPTPAATATEVRPTVTPFPTTTSVPDDEATDEATGAATEGPAVTQAPVTLDPEIISNSEGILLNGEPMVYVAGGSFTMGDGGVHLAHTVTLSPFYIDKYEVTNARWEACVAAGACAAPFGTQSYDGTPYYGEPDYADYPVIFVDWHNANAFCNWLGARLPTEAEWEMAARYNAATDEVSAYPWGNEWEPVANICDTNCPLPGLIPSVDDGYGQTAPVGSYADGASPAGVLDMAGNVAEWVGDWYSSGYYATSPEDDPTGPATGTLKVVRGGAWGVNAQGVLSTSRSRFQPWVSGPGLGLRCAIPASDVNP